MMLLYSKQKHVTIVAFSRSNWVTNGLIYLPLDWLIFCGNQSNAEKINQIMARLHFENTTIILTIKLL